MRSREFITELFNTEPLELEWDGYGEEQEAKARLPARPGYPSDVLRIKFTEVGDGVAEVFFSLNDDFNLTGRGNVSVIFATVINAITDYVRDMEDNVETIIFTAKEPSRARMYDTISKRVAAKFGWHVVPYDEMQKRYIDYLDALDFNFVIAKGPAPKQYKDVNKPQHGEFKPILYVYHIEDPNLPSIKLHAKSDEEAWQWVVNNMSKIQGYKDQEIDTKKLRATTIKPGLRQMLDLTKLTESPEEYITPPNPQTRLDLIKLWDKFAAENPKVKWVLDMLPISGSVTSGIDAATLANHGRYGEAAIAALGLAPMVKPLLKLQRFGLTPQQVNDYNALLKTSQRARNVDKTVDTTQAIDQSVKNNVRENFAYGPNPQATNQESGPEWESKLMDVWSPKASRYMARVVKQSFNSLYPDVKLKVWAEDEGVSATTDLASVNVKADVFGQYSKKDWECNFFCGPLFYHADGLKYLELMVEDAASGSYPGVWRIILSEWKKWASSQLKKTGADDVCFSVDEDMSGGAWEKVAGAVGIKFIARDLDEGYRRQIENFADGRNPQDKGDSKRHGVPTKASIGTLRKVAKQGGRKGQLAHWMANMKAGKARKK